MVPEPLHAEIARRVGSAREAAWILEHVGAESGDAEAALQLADRRASGEPLQYVLGVWPFRTIELVVGPAALIPRPETEQLVEIALERCRRGPAPRGQLRCADLGTGSGAIGLSVATELRAEADVELHLVDVSVEALELAAMNAERLDVPVALHHGSWFEALDPSWRGSFDLVIANPPYVPDAERGRLDPVLDHEPALALYAGDGTDGTPGFREVELLFTGARPWLAAGGILAIEMGEAQVGRAAAAAEEVGLLDVERFVDLAGRPRGIVGVAP